MPLILERNDITKMKVDAIVNAANSSLLGGGGVDGAIHRAAGPELLEECRTLHGCTTGEAKITRGYRLPCKYVIHTVGPIYQDGRHGEKQLLVNCYENSLKLAVENHCESIAFPMISAGVYGYPKDQALQVAVDTIRSFLEDHDLTVYLIVFDARAVQLSKSLVKDLNEYIDDHYVALSAKQDIRSVRTCSFTNEKMSVLEEAGVFDEEELSADSSQDLAKFVNQTDESFTQMLLRKIDEKGMTDSACYKKANIDRKLFSKIRSDEHYKPSKETALAFAIALELSLDETEDLLMKAGYALSNSSKEDLIIKYHIQHRLYNIFDINKALLFYDQRVLGI